MTKWLGIGIQVNQNMVDDNIDDIINDIVYQILDPCLIFDEIVSVEYLDNSVYSIISGNPTILYS